MRDRSGTLRCDKCGKCLYNYDTYVTVKTFRTEKAKDYYTREVKANRVIHLHNNCYNEIFKNIGGRV